MLSSSKITQAESTQAKSARCLISHGRTSSTALRAVFVFAAALLLSTAAAKSAAVDALEAVRAAELDAAAAIELQGVNLDTGVGRLIIDQGHIFPVRTTDGKPTELVFIGDGEVQMAPDDDIESSQLEMFTGGVELREPFSEAVIVIASESAQDALLNRPSAETETLDPDLVTRARSLLQQWRDRRERELFEVESSIALGHMGDRLYSSYFTAWFRGQELGDFFLTVQPEEREQVTIGRFEPFEVESEKQEKRLRRSIVKLQRRGRMLGLEFDDLGRWDTWVSTSLRNTGGEAVPGRPGFEPRHYELEAEIDPKDLELRGRVVIDLEVMVNDAWSVPLQLHRDLEIDRVTDGYGRELHVSRQGQSARVFLAEAANQETVRLEVAYHGRILEEGLRKNWSLSDNILWHPHAGERDQATYDVTLRWPKRFELLAGGELVEEGLDGSQRWQRRKQTKPCMATAFALGRYRQQTATVARPEGGQIKVTVAIDDTLQGFDRKTLKEVTDVVTSSLEYYQEVFGAYPYQDLAVVSVPGSVSQSLPGFVTLAEFMLLGNEKMSFLAGLEDRRMVVSHEIAHQWWGHSVGWDSYRDQWISEAMANYSALLWARNGQEGDALRVLNGPTSGWSRALTTTLADGRTVESVGPLVLGARLSSSRSASAYGSIVYRKGAVVLDMLARHWGEDHFVKVIGAVAQAAAGHTLDTAQLLKLMEQATGADLQPFARRFIYGTGLVDVYYDYTTEDLGGGKWKIHIVADQEVPYRFQYTVAETETGLDVQRQRVDQITEDAVRLVVPVQIMLADNGKKRKKDSRRIMNGRVLLEGRHTEIDIEIEEKPESLKLDGESEVFGRFFNGTKARKRVAYYKAYDIAATGDAEKARQAYREVLTTDTPLEPDADRSERKYQEQDDDYYNSLAHLQLSRLEIEEGNLNAAQTELQSARTALGKQDRLAATFDYYGAKIAVRKGNADEAFRILRKVVLKKGSIRSTEAWLWLAAAAFESKHTKELKEALEEVKDRGVELGPLAEFAD